MKALSVHQPAAQFIVLGHKKYEIRSWPTSHRGELAIAATLARPKMQHIPPLSRQRNNPLDRQTWMVIDTITDPAYQGPRPQGSRVPKRAQTPTLYYPHEGPHAQVDPETGYAKTVYLSLGAIVGSVRVPDCLKIVDNLRDAYEGKPNDRGASFILMRNGRISAYWYPPNDTQNRRHIQDITDQLPCCPFEPGMWAWVLEDAKPTEERCPACWGKGWGPINEAFCYRCGAGTENEDGTPWPTDNCPDCGCLVRREDCICDGRGKCDPIPAKGKRRLWEWIP